MLDSNAIMIHRDLILFPNAQVELILDSIQPRMVCTRIYWIGAEHLEKYKISVYWFHEFLKIVEKEMTI